MSPSVLYFLLIPEFQDHLEDVCEELFSTIVATDEENSEFISFLLASLWNFSYQNSNASIIVNNNGLVVLGQLLKSSFLY